MKKQKNLILNLQLFSAESGNDGVNAESGENNIADAGQSDGNVVLSSDEEFESLINGKFKEQFHKRTQSIIDKRFKETKELEEFKEKVSPLLETLNEKYSVEDGDTELLIKKVSEEESKEISDDNNKRSESLKARVASWVKETDEVKSVYPDFDFKNELNGNPLFGKLLYSGVPLKSAYEVIHKDEILSGAMAYTAQKVREQVVKGIEAKGRRPLENGVTSETGIVTVTDVNALTPKDILKILKQVENGANIKF